MPVFEYAILLAAITAVVTLSAVISTNIPNIGMLSSKMVTDWFKKRKDIMKNNKSNIAFILNQKIDDPQHKLIQGIFNQETNSMLDAISYSYISMDFELLEILENNELVVYQ